MINRVVPLKTYVLVWVGLLVLLALTCGSAYLPMGVFNVIANLGISLAKVLLVMVYFMHLRHANGVLRMFSGVGFVWLMFLFVLSLSDYLTRIALPSPW